MLTAQVCCHVAKAQKSTSIYREPPHVKPASNKQLLTDFFQGSVALKIQTPPSMFVMGLAARLTGSYTVWSNVTQCLLLQQVLYAFQFVWSLPLPG